MVDVFSIIILFIYRNRKRKKEKKMNNDFFKLSYYLYIGKGIMIDIV